MNTRVAWLLLALLSVSLRAHALTPGEQCLRVVRAVLDPDPALRNLTPPAGPVVDAFNVATNTFLVARQINSILGTSKIAHDFSADARPLMKAAAGVLDEGKAVYTPVTLEGNAEAFEISATEGTTHLNRFAKRMWDKYQVKVVYAPTQPGYAGYQKSNKRLYLPHDAIRELGPEPYSFHEEIHALFHFLERSGKDSLFLTDFVSIDGKTTLLENKGYSHFLSAEELATYADGTNRLVDEIGRELRGSSPKLTKLTAAVLSIKGQSEVAQANARSVRMGVAEVLDAVEKDRRQLKVSSEVLDGANGEKTTVFYATIEIGNMYMRMRVLSGGEAKGSMRALLDARLKGSKNTDEAQAALSEAVRDLAIARMKKQTEISTLLEAQNAQIHKVASTAATLADFAELMRVARIPLTTVRPYIEWQQPVLER